MVTIFQRRLIVRLLRLRVLRLQESMRLPWISARRGFGWLLERIKRAQLVDDLHHAPCWPANHYHRQRLVLHPCTCGAARASQGEEVR
jgi:hypothetical protein